MNEELQRELVSTPHAWDVSYSTPNIGRPGWRVSDCATVVATTIDEAIAAVRAARPDATLHFVQRRMKVLLDTGGKEALR